MINWDHDQYQHGQSELLSIGTVINWDHGQTGRCLLQYILRKIRMMGANQAFSYFLRFQCRHESIY